MKRFLIISLSVLLILPVFLLPCFAAAASEYQFVYNSEYEFFVCPVELPSGSYTGVWTSDLGVFTIQQFDYLPVYSPDTGEFTAFIPVTLIANDVSFVLDIAIAYSSSAHFTVIGFKLADEGITVNGVVSLTPVSSGDVSFLSDLSSVASAVIDWCSQIAQVIVSRPLLLFTVGIFFVGGCIALFSRFLSRD